MMRSAILLTLSIAACAALGGSSATAPPSQAGQVAVQPGALKSTLLAMLEAEGYGFTLKTRAAFLAYAKAQARADLRDMNKDLPEEFLRWVESDPDVEATVYGARPRPADVLLVLYGLRLDLGRANFEKYRQLMLAMAVANFDEGPNTDLSPRGPLTLVIPADPLHPVNTNDPGRTLDVNDHIINFLNSRTIEEDVQTGTTTVAEKKTPVMEHRTRTLVAADVMASKELQADFNAYMKSHGETVEIHCASPKRSTMIPKDEIKDLDFAYKLFDEAYVAKGLLPGQRDAVPTLAETCAFLIRNDRYVFSPEAKRKWPLYPLDAPWPTLTFLALERQPLRECEDIWRRYQDTGEFHTYGDYVGSIAQQGEFLAARKLQPFDFALDTIQIMLKDGGVCGVMANIATRTYLTCGIPASTAGQPGHCALIRFTINDKDKTYNVAGEQFVTGGPEKTDPHLLWIFDTTPAHKMMVYHSSIAWAMNDGVAEYLDSAMAYQVFLLLPQAQRQQHGMDLLESGMAINPYNFVLVDAAQKLASTPQQQIALWHDIEFTLAGVHKPGCPMDGLYNQTIKEHMYTAIAAETPPANRAAAAQVYAFLQADKCDNAKVMARYQTIIEGLQATLARAEGALQKHLAAERTEATCGTMVAAMEAAAGEMTDKKAKAAWVLARWTQVQGHEAYFDGTKVAVDSTATVLAKLAAKKLAAQTTLVQPLLGQVEASLAANVAGERTAASCKKLAERISAVAAEIKDLPQQRPWLDGLAKIIAGHEEYQPKGAKKGAKPLRDPCAEVIKNLRDSFLESPVEAGAKP